MKMVTWYFSTRRSNNILDDIKDDLAEFGVHFDKWFSERDLEESGPFSMPSTACARMATCTRKTVPPGSRQPTWVMKKTGWWSVKTAAPPISPRILLTS